MRFLVIEDDDGLCRAIQDSLRSSAPDLDVGGDGCGQDAIRRVRSGFRPDVALVDLFLPDGSGLELAAKLRELGVPRIVGMTGKNEPPVDEILELFDDFLLKPFEMDALTALLLAPDDFCYREGGTRLDPPTRT